MGPKAAVEGDGAEGAGVVEMDVGLEVSGMEVDHVEASMAVEVRAAREAVVL